MRYPKKLSRLCLATASTLLACTASIQFAADGNRISATLDHPAFAKSSGGRAGGGSFRSTPSRSSGSSRSSSRSNSSWDYKDSPSYSSPPPYYRRDPYYDSYNRGPVIIPMPGRTTYGNSSYPSNTYPPTGSSVNQSSNGGELIVALLLLGVAAPVIFFIVFSMLRKRGGSGSGFGGSNSGELGNDTVTVSQVQVALLAQARETQAELSRLSLQIDTSTAEGLLQLLQEAALALLRTPENWSHVLGRSETVRNSQDAEVLFNQLSIIERSKFSVETLTNVGGRKNRYQGFKPDPDEGPGSYIVVTFLVGTAHDQPLFSEIRTTEALKQILEKLASLPADYLLVFELLWSPQEEADSLTYDELLTEYTDMAQI